MPVTFEQPQPVSPQISAAYGSTEQLSHDLPAIASIYQRNAAMQQAAAEHAQSLQAQMVGQQAGIGERRLEMQQHGMDQAAQFATSRLPSERDAFLAQSELAQQDRRAQNAAWLNQQQLSQQEQMDLQKMKESVGYVQNNPNLTDDEKENFITRLRTKIDPMEMRLKQQQVEHQQKQDQLIDGQLRKQAEHEETNRQFQAQMMKEGKAVVTWVDDNGRRHPLIKNEKTGEWYNPLQSSHEVTARLEAARQEKVTQLEQAEETNARSAFEKARKEIVEDVRRREMATVKDATGKDTGQYMYQSLQTPEGVKKRIDEELAARLGGSADEEAYVKRRLDAFRRRRGGSVTAPDGGGGGADPGASQPSQPNQTPAEQKFVAENKPFDLKTLGDATPTQKTLVAGWNAMGKNVERYTQDQQQLGQYRQSAAWAVRALGTYGTEMAMPGPVKQRYESILAAMKPFLRPPPATTHPTSFPSAEAATSYWSEHRKNEEHAAKFGG